MIGDGPNIRDGSESVPTETKSWVRRPAIPTIRKHRGEVLAGHLWHVSPFTPQFARWSVIPAGETFDSPGLTHPITIGLDSTIPSGTNPGSCASGDPRGSGPGDEGESDLSTYSALFPMPMGSRPVMMVSISSYCVCCWDTPGSSPDRPNRVERPRFFSQRPSSTGKNAPRTTATFP